ncbi:MAG: LytTR family DNA-binding domain-containing protein [Saprospiraceae bacterium]|nr:LytTR family DNA-binding domain-containing protein [Saprospiraceae bacterium]
MKTKILKAYIVEDEQASLENLTKIIKKYCKNLLLIGNAGTVADAVSEIPHLDPDIVFLDIELPNENGFKLFDYLPNHEFEVIFTTAYSEFAIKAFNYSAIHYILKPIDIDELQTAIKKVVEMKSEQNKRDQVQIWNSVNNQNFSKIVLPTQDGLHFIETDDIVWCEAKSNYTLFHILGRENILVSKSLKTYEDSLNNKSFFRCSRSSLINLNHIVHCSKHLRMEITMIDGSVIVLGERRKAVFKEIFETKK